jgi:hypothetical protein
LNIQLENFELVQVQVSRSSRAGGGARIVDGALARANFRYAPRASEALLCSEMTRWAIYRHWAI